MILGNLILLRIKTRSPPTMVHYTLGIPNIRLSHQGIPTQFNMPFSGSSYFVDYDTAKVRLGLRVYFAFFFILLAAASNTCSGLRIRLGLLRDKPIRLPLATGWLDGVAAIKAWIVQRSLPGGWFGIVTILTWLLSVSSDWMVSGLVKTTMIVSRCEFGRGVICNLPNNTMLNAPARENPSVAVVQQAQNNSIANGGLSGIFRKANTDPYFRADPEDLLGTWVCEFTGNDTYPYTANMTDIVTDLIHEGRLYNATLCHWYYGIDLQGWNSLTVASPSQPDGIKNIPFDVCISRDSTPNEDLHDRTMSSYFCSMNASAEIEWILVQMQPETMLQQWLPMFQAVLGVDNDTHVSNAIVSTLDLITMVGQDGWILSDSEPLTNKTIDTTQGCLAPRAGIPPSVIFILAVVTFAVAAFLVYWRILQAQLHQFHQAEYQTDHRIGDTHMAVPNSLVDWMVYVAQQFYPQAQVRAKDLSKFVFMKDSEGHVKVNFDGGFVSGDRGSQPTEGQHPIHTADGQWQYRFTNLKSASSGNRIAASPRPQSLGVPHRKPVGSSGE